MARGRQAQFNLPYVLLVVTELLYHHGSLAPSPKAENFDVLGRNRHC